MLIFYNLVTSPSQFHSHVLGDKANHSLWTSNTLLCNTLISLMQYIHVWNFLQRDTTINYITYFLLYSCCYCYSKMKLKLWAAYYKTSTSDSTEAKNNSSKLSNVLIENCPNIVGGRKLRCQNMNTALEIINIYIDYLQTMKASSTGVHLRSTLLYFYLFLH